MMMASMKQWASEAISMKQWATEAIPPGWVWGPLVAYYAPRGLSRMYFNKHLRRYARRLVPFLDPFVSIDIVSTRGEGSSDNAYKEVEAYLTNKVCMREDQDAHAFCAEGTVEGCSGFLLSLGEGQEVTDNFQGVTVWWSSATTKSTTDMRETACFRLMFPQQHRAKILDEYLPHVRQTGRENLFVTIDVVEQDKHSTSSDLKFSEAFEEVKAFLNSTCSRDAHDLYAHGTVRGDSFLISLRKGEEVAHSFNGVTLRWSSPKSSDDFGSTKCFRLMFPQEHRASILDEYLPHVRRQGRNNLIGQRGQRLYSNRGSSSRETSSLWSHIDFEHPTTFDTLAMQLDKKDKIKQDLDNFRRNEDYYRRIGKPWKRGYLLYGPPGTGKSTMIAAMANYLKYDIYDMELTSVSESSNLRSLLVEIPGKSIIVFEDIDCCFDDVTSQRSKQEERGTLSRYRNDNDGDRDKDKSKVTLSGLLNFIDGVWSAQAGERIIVFTTNFRDKLDQALIRSGRMDVHIEMSYCCYEAFQTLAMNYLGVREHSLFQCVKELLQVVEITPADVAECFLRSHSDFAGSERGVEMETCIRRLIDELKTKAAEQRKRRLVPFLDPFVTIDIVSNKSSTSGQESGQSSDNTYKEVEAYLTKVCMRDQDAHAFCAEGTVEGCSGFLLRLGEGQEVTDDFRGVTVRWLSTTTKTTISWSDTRPCFRLMFPQQHRALILDEYLPHVCQTGREKLFVTIDIVEQDKHSMLYTSSDLKFSEAFEEVKAYLNSACSRDAHDLYADGTVRGDSFLFSLRNGEEVADSFKGVTLRWSSPRSSNDYGRNKCFRLMFPQKRRALILDEYLPHVRRQGRNIMHGKRVQRLYNNRSSSSWSHIDFEHPTTFKTLAMHPDKKRKIEQDLNNFCGNKDYYHRIGKPWKRGYLLYGPPGTGRSTMIAAMANHLNYDIYDMELTSVSKNSDLRSLLVKIPGKSIVVFEDIDCCFDDAIGQRSNQEGRTTSWRNCNDKDDDKSKVTLSGLLNFIDGVWSAQTGERIIVLTTNFPDKLDRALIRSGRMDMHIEMSYCCYEAFQTLAMNYLGLGEEGALTEEMKELFKSVKELLQVVEITPADVAECFLRSQSEFAGSDRGVDPETCIRCLIDELEKKKAALNELEKKAAQPQPKKPRLQ